MRSRAIREGSVGLLLLAGLGVFGVLVLWLLGFNPRNRTYQFTVTFPNILGMETGAAVRYRGSQVGKIKDIRAGSNGIDVVIEIERADLLIPHDVKIEANQAGLISQTSIDITPNQVLTTEALSLNPLNSECVSEQIICNEDRLSGEVGVSLVELLRQTTRVTQAYSTPEFFDNVNSLTKNASVAVGGIGKLTNELSLLSRSVRGEIGAFSDTADTLTSTANQTLAQVGSAAERFGETADTINSTVGRFGATADTINSTVGRFGSTVDKVDFATERFGETADKIGSATERFGETADKIGNTTELTGTQLNQLMTSANELLVTNRANLVGGLDNLRQSSERLSDLLGNLSTTVTKVNSTIDQAQFVELLDNFETLSANAAAASENFKDISTSLNSQQNLVLLQQTLESARGTFANAQKITADLDDLTGDPDFRNNLKELVNGLGNLVSTTQQLQQQVEVAQSLEPVSDAINVATVTPLSPQPEQPKLEETTTIGTKVLKELDDVKNVEKQMEIGDEQPFFIISGQE
ncbi:MAG: MCE family protein [Symploca sp. SIO1A3]|nr:MCE family protein [Symploca sp. SIO1A3]